MDKGSLLTVVDSMNERIFPGISKKICRDESFISMGKIVFGRLSHRNNQIEKKILIDYFSVTSL